MWVCRVAALIAGALYLPGAPLNAPVLRNVVADGRYYLKCHVFTRAAWQSLVATALGITSYIMLTSTPAQTAAPAATGTKPKLGGPGLRANALSAPHERVWSTTEPVGEHTAAGTQPNKKLDNGLYPPAVGLPQWPAQGCGQAPYPHHAEGLGQAPNLQVTPPVQGREHAKV
ncbi:hypothetical protein EJB05_35693, partial [Eragrostis curvula]